VTVINKWQWYDKECLSDYRIVRLCIETNKDITNDYNFHGTKYVKAKKVLRDLMVTL
jgi:hypothetical protein